MRLLWKSFCLPGFILLLVFAGCGERQPPVDELVLQAETFLNAGQIESAIRILERCEERAPQRVDVLESLAFAYAADGDPMLASMTFLRIAELVPDQPEYLLYAAESLLEAEDPKGAVDRYESYLEKRPEDRAVWVTLADLHISRGNINDALEALLAAEQIESRARQRVRIGELYLRKNNLAQAQAWFSRSLEGDPEMRDEALLGLLETAIRARRFSDAEGLLSRLDAEYPGRLEQSEIDHVRDQLAEWRRRRDAAEEAVAALDARGLGNAAEVPVEPAAGQPAPPGEGEAPDQAPAIEQEPVVQTQEPLPLADPPERAAAPADEPPPAALQPAREPAQDHLSRARAYREEGNVLDAIRHYKQALVENDEQPLVWAELSELYLQSGNDRWAQATASEAMRRDPDNPKLVLQFLRAAQRTMEPDRVIREMESAYRQFPNQPEIILVLARAYADQGNVRNARILYRKFLERVPEDHPARATALRESREPGF